MPGFTIPNDFISNPAYDMWQNKKGVLEHIFDQLSSEIRFVFGHK